MSSPASPLPRAALVGTEGLYVTSEDFLRLTSRNSAASVRLALGLRFLPLGDVRARPSVTPHLPNTDRSSATLDMNLTEGWIQGLTVRATAGAPPLGACYVRVDLMRGSTAAPTLVAELLGGYITGAQGLGWPGSLIMPSIGGPANMRSITGTDPGAGVEISETVPTGARWRLLALRASLVTDVTVANREAAITFDDGALVYAEFASGANQAASLTRQYTASRQGVRGAAASATSILIAIPDLWLPAGHRIRTSTTAIVAGDNWSAPQLLVEEQLEAAS
jgi:hypothetical protein